MTGIAFRPDGPHSDDYTAALSDAFYLAVRTLNHATMPGPGVTYPSTVYAVLGDLTAGTYGVGQVLDQLGGFLDGEHAAGRLGDDRHPDRDPAEVLARIREHLTEARKAAEALSLALASTHAAVSGLHTRSPSQAGEES